MKKFPIVSVLIMIAALAAAFYISGKNGDLRTELYKNTPDRMTEKYFPMPGIDKFYADISWIHLLQQMGDPNVKMKDDVGGHAAAKHFHSQLDKITSLDPDCNLVYTVGGMHIAHLEPQLALDLLDKGNRLSTNPDWNRYRLMSFIEDKYVSDRVTDDDPEMKTKKAESLNRSAEYLRTAIDMGGVPLYIETAWLRKVAEQKGISNDPLALLKAEVAYYQEKMKASQPDTAEDAPEGAPEAGAPDAEPMAYEAMEDSRLEAIRERIMSKARGMALDSWRVLNDPKASEADKKKNAKLHANVTREFFKVAPKNEHYSKASLNSYGAGVFYDVVTGTRVAPFGICYKCYHEGTPNQITITHGSYCHICGKSTSESAKQWDEWSKQNKIE